MPPAGASPPAKPPPAEPPGGLRARLAALGGALRRRGSAAPRPAPGPRPPQAGAHRRRLRFLPLAVLALVLAALLYTFITRSQVQAAFAGQRFEAVVAAVDRAPWLRLAQPEAERYAYSRARLLLAAGRPGEALPLLEALAGFEDSAALARDVWYARAEAALAAGDAEGALEIFQSLGGHRDSAARAAGIEAYRAAAQITDPMRRYRAFAALGNLLDSPAQAEAAARQLYAEAMAVYEGGDLAAADAAFARIEAFGDVAGYRALCALWQSGMAPEEARALLPKLEEAARSLDIGPVAEKKEILPWLLDGAWATADGKTAVFDYAEYRRDFEGVDLAGPYIYADGMLRPVGHAGPVVRFDVTGYDAVTVSFGDGESWALTRQAQPADDGTAEDD